MSHPLLPPHRAHSDTGPSLITVALDQRQPRTTPARYFDQPAPAPHSPAGGTTP